MSIMVSQRVSAWLPGRYMPNHVTNWVEISGTERQIAELKSKTFKTDSDGRAIFDFNGVIPMPENVFTGDLGALEREQYGKDNWYDWSIANWGTKWNAYNFDLLHENMTTVVIRFDTAWSSPTQIFERLKEASFQVNCFWHDEDGPEGEFGDPYDCFDVTHEIYVEYYGEPA